MQNLNPNYEGTKILGREKIEADNIIRHVMTVASLVAPVHTVLFLTSTHWGQFMNAIRQHAPNPPDPTTRRMVIGNNCTCCKPAQPYLEVVNSGSEDQDAVDLANEAAAQNSGFAWKRDNWRVG